MPSHHAVNRSNRESQILEEFKHNTTSFLEQTLMGKTNNEINFRQLAHRSKKWNHKWNIAFKIEILNYKFPIANN
jgi:chorismate mutase